MGGLVIEGSVGERDGHKEPFHPTVRPERVDAVSRSSSHVYHVIQFPFFGDKEVQPQAANILSYKLLYFHWEVQATRTCFF